MNSTSTNTTSQDEGGGFNASTTWETSTLSPSNANEPSSSSHQPPSTTTTTAYSAYTNVLDTHSTTNEKIHSVKVLDGKTELEGTSDMFVSYLVTLQTTDSTGPSLFSTSSPSSRRRFQDFVFLRQSLVKDFQACVVPPLPDKHRMEYVVGDRFSQEFIEKRRIDLERFLQRLSKHPKLSRTNLFVNFIESTEWNVYKHKYQAANNHHHSSTSTSSVTSDDGNSPSSPSQQQPHSNGLLDNISDTLLNAFTKLKKPDPRFTQIRTHLDSFEEGLTHLERLGNKSKTRLNDLSNDYEDFSTSIQGLGYLESGITEPLMRFERSLMDFSNCLKQNSLENSSEFLQHLHSLIGFSQVFKNQVLKTRDQKQLDFEELSTYLSNVVTERDRLAGGYSYGMGLGSYFKEKLEGLKVVGTGADSDMSKAARLQRLDSKIKELQEAVLASQQTSTAFNEAVLQEYEIFKSIKRWEMKKLLREYAKGQIEFQKKVLNSWDKTIPFIKRIHVEP
ncbi:hypothetical protein JCM5350_008264 [Sporobolomyces pararoseus]